MFVTFWPDRVTLCVTFYCDIMDIIISTGLQSNTGMKLKLSEQKFLFQEAL